MVKVFFPNMFMRLVSLNNKVNPGIAKLQVPPSMTKTDIKEYLTKIYQVNVLSVNTHNMMGNWRRFYFKRRILSYKNRNYKSAFVKFDNPNPSQE